MAQAGRQAGDTRAARRRAAWMLGLAAGLVLLAVVAPPWGSDKTAVDNAIVLARLGAVLVAGVLALVVLILAVDRRDGRLAVAALATVLWGALAFAVVCHFGWQVRDLFRVSTDRVGPTEAEETLLPGDPEAAEQGK